MTTENNNGSTPPAEPAAPAAEVKPGVVETEAIKPGDALEHKPGEGDPDSIPREAPPAGCEYVYSPETGIWNVRRIRTDAEIAADYDKAVRAPKEGEEEKPAAVAITEPLTMPEHLPQSLRDDDTVAEVQGVGQILGESGYTAAQAQRLVDLTSEFALETGRAGSDGHPDINNRDAVEGTLRSRWGSTYDANMKACKAAAQKLGPKFLDWLDKGPGNYIPVIETLAALGRGDFSLSKEAAQKALAEMRKPGTPLMNANHKDHKYAVTRSRILTERISRGDGDTSAVESALRASFTSGVRENVHGTKPTPPAAVMKGTGDEARIAELRKSPAYFDKRHPNHVEVRAEIEGLYSKLYPGTRE